MARSTRHALAMHTGNYVIGVSNNVIVNRSNLRNSVSVHRRKALVWMRPSSGAALPISCGT